MVAHVRQLTMVLAGREEKESKEKLRLTQREKRQIEKK